MRTKHILSLLANQQKFESVCSYEGISAEHDCKGRDEVELEELHSGTSF